MAGSISSARRDRSLTEIQKKRGETKDEEEEGLGIRGEGQTSQRRPGIEIALALLRHGALLPLARDVTLGSNYLNYPRDGATYPR